MGNVHEGWWTELGLHDGRSGTKGFDWPYWDARLGPLRQYPPVAFQHRETGHTITLAELRALIKEREAALDAKRRRI